MALLGEAGAGKSTALQFLGLSFATGNGDRSLKHLGLRETRYPVLVSLSASAEEIAKGADGLMCALACAVQERLQCKHEQARDLVEVWAAEEHLLVLLDGLDEVPSAVRAGVRRKLESFLSSPKGRKSRFIVTSRLAGFDAVKGLPEYVLKPLGDRQTETLPYLARWLAVLRPEWEAVSESKASHLLEQMQTQPALGRALRNPLLLRLAAEEYVRTGQVARNRAALYQCHVEEMWRRSKERGAREDEKGVAMDALEAVAWHLQRGGSGNESSLQRALLDRGGASGRVTPVPSIATLREKMGILVRLPQEPEPIYAFSHETLREFFVARRLRAAWERSPRNTFAFMRPCLHLPAWREPIALLAGSLGKGEAARLMCHVLHARSPYEWKLKRDITLSALLGGESGVGGKVRESILHGLMGILRENAGGVHDAAMEALKAIGRPSDVPHMANALRDGDEGSRRAAAEALGATGDPSAVPGLLAALRDRDEGVRWAAAGALGEIGAPSAVAGLLTALRARDGDLGVRWAAVDALGEIGDPSGVPDLLAALRDGDEGLRQAAAEALGAIGDPSAVPGLLAALRDRHGGVHGGVRGAAARALGAIKAPSAVLEPGAALWDESGVRWAAVDAVGVIGGPSAVPHLLAVLRDGDEGLREAAAEALGAIGDPSAVLGLVAALWDEGGVRWAAARSLGAIGDPSGVPGLLAALRDGDEGLRQAAAEALGAIGDPSAVPGLLAALRDGHGGVRGAAARSLGAIGDPSAVPGLLVALRDGHGGVRQAAAAALGAIGDPSAVLELVAALWDEVRVRWAAADALGAIGGPSAVPHLLAALRDRDVTVRWVAAEALGAIGDPSAVPGLLAALRDGHWGVCDAAAEALEAVGDPSAVPTLVAALKEGNRRVREAAAGALWTIGDPSALPVLLPRPWSGRRWLPDWPQQLARLLSRLEGPEGTEAYGAFRGRIRRLVPRLSRQAPCQLRELSELLDQLGRLELAASPHQDPLKPMPVPSWRRGKNLTHLVMWVLAGLAAVLAALQSEAVHALKPFFVRFFGAHPWIAFAAVAVLGALCAWLAWVLHHLRRTK